MTMDKLCFLVKKLKDFVNGSTSLSIVKKALLLKDVSYVKLKAA